MESSKNFAYMFYGLLGEVDELVEKVNEHVEEVGLNHLARKLMGYGQMAKKIRKEPESMSSEIWRNIFESALEKMADDEGIKGEIGDCAWFINSFCTILGWKVEDICQMNLDKLASRQKRDKIDGDGDNR